MCAAVLLALAAGTLGFVLIVRRYGSNPAWSNAGTSLLDTDGREIWEAIALGVCLVLAVAAPRFGRKIFGRLEVRFSRFAARRTLAITAAGLFPVVLRLSLLPVIPIPKPHVADEFGYLLLAETFASGRITNPTHPMWRFFESLYIFHQPTYSSQYPIAQGLVMALPLVLGAHPWFGILFSAGLMCAALCWMLQGWLPPKWALLGALIAGARFDVVTSWMNTYWGGATPAIGGALLMGALPRLLRHARLRDILLAGAGLFILSQSRPFEGILLSLPVGIFLITRFWRGTGRKHSPVRALAPLAAVSLLVIASGLYYNWRVTGHALQLPYQLHQRIYGTPQNLLWSPPVATAARVAQFKDIRDNFEWQYGLFEEQSTWIGLADTLPVKLRSYWDFFLQPILSLPLLLLPLVWRRDDLRFLFATCLFVLLAEFLLYPFFYPHYAALLCGPLLVLVLQGARYLRTLRWRGRPVGDAMFRWSFLCGAISSILLVAGAVLSPVFIAQASTPRSQIEEQLKQRGGKHLVIVRYTPRHSIHEPWIYNSADVDRSPIVWARELDDASMQILLHYYADRQVWLVNADAQTPSVIPYADRYNPQISAMHNAAGKSPFVDKGVSPGSLVTLFGTNLGPADPEGTNDCQVSGYENETIREPDVQLPGLDGARPGVPVRGHSEKLPRLVIGETTLYWGATFVLTDGHQRTAPVASDPQRLAVQFGNLPAPVLCVQPSGEAQAATVLVPAQLQGDSVDIGFRAGGHESVEKHVPVLPAYPGILQLYSAGRRAVLLHPDGNWVSPWNRAHRGETLRMFVTGIGRIDQKGPENPIIVGVNDRGAPLEFVNCQECSRGIAELGFQVPQETPAGDHVSLSVAVVANGKTVYSMPSVLAVQ